MCFGTDDEQCQQLLDKKNLTVSYQVRSFRGNPYSEGNYHPGKDGGWAQLNGDGNKLQPERGFSGLVKLKVDFGGAWAKVYDTRICIQSKGEKENSPPQTYCGYEGTELIASSAESEGRPVGMITCVGVTTKLKAHFQYTKDLVNDGQRDTAMTTCK